jgi:hypothetical protein
MASNEMKWVENTDENYYASVNALSVFSLNSFPYFVLVIFVVLVVIMCRLMKKSSLSSSFIFAYGMSSIKSHFNRKQQKYQQSR